MVVLASVSRLGRQALRLFLQIVGHRRTNDRTSSHAERLLAPLGSARSSFVSAAIFSGVMNILMLSGSIFMLQVYDRVLPSRSIATLQALVLLVLVLYASFALLDALRTRIFARIGGRIDRLLGGDVFEFNLRRGLPGGSSVGLSPFRDLEQLRGFLASGGPAALFDLPWTPLYVGLLFILHPALGWLGVAGIASLAALAWRTERATAPIQQQAGRWTAEASAWAESSRRGAEALVPMGMGNAMRKQWLAKNRAAGDATMAAADVAGHYGAISKFVRMGLQSIVLALGAFLVIAGEATGGVMIAASILIGRSLAPVELAIGQWRGFIATRQSYARLKKMLQSGDEPATRLPPPCSRLDVEKLAVVVGDQKLRLRDVNFTLEAGDALGVIGPSGSGKSTLVRALVGVLEGVRGSVRFDGSTLDQWGAADLERIIGYLPQDVELFPGTVAQNIARFDSAADPSEVLAAAKSAGVDEFIRGLPEGFDTVLGERGAGISAGERQRIALARALYGAPFLVVLDEPNSALDAQGEAALTQVIAGIRKRKGIAVVVAHRPSVLRAVNKMLVLSNGQQTQFGPREEILEKVLPPVRPNSRPAVAIGSTP